MARTTDQLYSLHTLNNSDDKYLTIPDSVGPYTFDNFRNINDYILPNNGAGGITFTSRANDGRTEANVDGGILRQITNVTQEMTIEMWFEGLVAPTPPENPSFIYGSFKNNTSTHNDWGIFLRNDGTLQYNVRTNVEGSPFGGQSTLALSIDSALHHFVVSQSLNRIDFYLDGVLVHTDTTSNAAKTLNLSGETYEPCLMSAHGSNDRQGIGSIYLTAIYTKALNQTEVTDNFNDGKPALAEVPTIDLGAAPSGLTDLDYNLFVPVVTGSNIQQVDYYLDNVQVHTSRTNPWAFNFEAHAGLSQTIKAVIINTSQLESEDSVTFDVGGTAKNALFVEPVIPSEVQVNDDVPLFCFVEKVGVAEPTNVDISQVEYFINGNSVGVVTDSQGQIKPYRLFGFAWQAAGVGAHTLFMRATLDTLEVIESRTINFNVIAEDLTGRLTSLNLRTDWQTVVDVNDVDNPINYGFIIDIPSGTNAGNPAPIIHNFTGLGSIEGDGTKNSLSRMMCEGLPQAIQEGKETGAIVVHYMANSWTSFSNPSGTYQDTQDAIAGIMSLVSSFVILDKVYVAGFSQGAVIAGEHQKLFPDATAGMLFVAGAYVRNTNVEEFANQYTDWHHHENDQIVNINAGIQFTNACNALNDTPDLHRHTTYTGFTNEDPTNNHNLFQRVMQEDLQVFPRLLSNELLAPWQPNNPPTVTHSVQATAVQGELVQITATPTDPQGEIDIAKVDFLVDDVIVFTATSSPWLGVWSAVDGTHSIYTRATDIQNGTGTSVPTNIVVSVVDTITVTVDVPATATTGDIVTLTATASDSVGSITQVEFFAGVASVGVDLTAPHSVDWTATVGTTPITAVATNDLSATKTSAADEIVVTDPVPVGPTVNLTVQSNAVEGQNVAISATASADGAKSITQVEFFVDNVSVGIDTTAPYSANYVAVLGVHQVKAIATDSAALTTETPEQQLTVVEAGMKKYLEGVGIKEIANVVAPGYENPLVYEFSFSSKDGLSLGGFNQVNFDWEDISINTTDNPDDIQVQGEKLYVWAGATATGETSNAKITGDGYLLTISKVIKPKINQK